MIIHWDEARRCGKRLLAWTLFAVIVVPFLVLFGSVAFALAASQAEHYVGTRASGIIGIVVAGVAVIVTLQALIWWTTK